MTRKEVVMNYTREVSALFAENMSYTSFANLELEEKYLATALMYLFPVISMGKLSTQEIIIGAKNIIMGRPGLGFYSGGRSFSDLVRRGYDEHDQALCIIEQIVMLVMNAECQDIKNFDFRDLVDFILVIEGELSEIMDETFSDPTICDSYDICKQIANQNLNDPQFYQMINDMSKLTLAQNSETIPQQQRYTVQNRYNVAPSTKTQNKKTDDSMVGVLLAFAIAMIILVFVVFGVNFGQPSKNEPVYTPEPTVSKPTLRAQPLPDNGEILVAPDYYCLCPFKVTAAPSSSFYVYLQYVDEPSNSVYDRVALADNPSENDIGFFVQAGDTVELNVPIGIYRVCYAAGDTWYGIKHKFGEDTVYKACNELFSFFSDYNSTHGYTLELRSQQNGNVNMANLSENSFPG